MYNGIYILYIQLLDGMLKVAQMIRVDVGNPGFIPGSGRSPGEGHGNLLQYSCLKNPMDRGAWRAIVHGAAKSWTQLKQLSMKLH